MMENKDITLRFRVTADERAVIEKKAQTAGLVLSEYVRRMALGQDVRERISPELRQVVIGVANNLNQLTRHAHTGQLDASSIEAILEQLKRALQ
ncbi:mobilization protein [Siphonobacter sp. BAB-5405]|nr:mobilization protein [Siphonobacter sp. BAB-5405]